MYLSSVNPGVTWTDVAFTSNSADSGGAIYSRASGIDEYSASTTYSRCRFDNNRASTTGGAVESVGGSDCFEDTSFVGNEARVGGAVGLAGTAILELCNFAGNSAYNYGPAVSNVGRITSASRLSFVDNKLLCDTGRFFGYSEVRLDSRERAVVIVRSTV